jgi:hypothetical protein
MKLRVFWAAFLGGDSNDGKRLEKLNESHFEALSILKEVERKSEERFEKEQNQFEYELLEAEAIVEDALYQDLKMLNFVRKMWDLNEKDRTMRIYSCPEIGY